MASKGQCARLHQGFNAVDYNCGSAHNCIAIGGLVTGIEDGDCQRVSSVIGELHSLFGSGGGLAGVQITCKKVIPARMSGKYYFPWHEAVKKDNQKVIKAFVNGFKNNGGRVSAKGFWGLTPLHLATIYGSVATICCLLRAGASPKTADNRKRTPLHWAAKHNSATAIRKLRNAGANIEARDADGLTPLQWAEKRNECRVIRALV